MNTHRHNPGQPDQPDLRSLDVAPVAIHPPYDQRRPRPLLLSTHDFEVMRADYLAALTEPLAGITLGTYDRRIVTWLAGWDIPTVGTVASLLHRARAAAPLSAGGAR